MRRKKNSKINTYRFEEQSRKEHVSPLNLQKGSFFNRLASFLHILPCHS